MLIPTDGPIEIPVTLTVVGATLTVTTASLVRLDGDELELVTHGLRLVAGERVIVGVDARTHLRGRVLATGAGAWARISRDGAHAVQDRAAPRVVADVQVEWRRADGEGGTDERRWLAGGRDRFASRWFTGPLELSVSGLLLPTGDGEPPPIGARLRLELRLPEHGRLRVIGIARRHDRGAVGVEFVEIGDDAADQLSAFTLAHL